ncbi:hypothetical protein Taro_032109 [Colocasia esculenta]|uniref:Uncharacterized protein n=1 Tax=Colocasia esculenta TaxID=4460 RepID=A0A843W8G4_COLES|nr:hypothetical protein [Colocasia esculenta]
MPRKIRLAKFKVQVLQLAGVVWKSSWWLESKRSSIPSSSSSPFRLLQPVQTVLLESTKVFCIFGLTLNYVQAGGRDSRAWYRVAQERRDPMKGVLAPRCDLGVDQSTPRVGLRTAWESAPL